MTKTNEEALEEIIETSLLNQGYYKGSPKDFNKQFAIDEKRFWHFLENSQEKKLEKLKRNSNYKALIISRLDKMIKRFGVLRVLKKGLDIEDIHLDLMYELPLPSSAKSIKENYTKNEFSITRQLTYSITNPREEIDIVIFINGLPIITMELKNIWTGQTAKFNGVKQYKFDRDIKQTLLNFARCIVHFAVDTDEIYMTTKLDGKNTFFLPFNKGNNEGAGNPVNPNGYKTAYLWEEILNKDSLIEIIQYFTKLDGKDTDKLNKKTLFFPRYHQLDVVRKLVKDVSENGVGKSYLIQHSAGSGKSNSITWSAYRLIETYSKDDVEKPIFDSVIVVTDRRILDKQIRKNIKNFSEQKNIIAPADSAKELKQHLENGKKIIITTIQKFPFIVDGINDLSHKNFGIIIDEAHSSQSGSAHDNMNMAIGESNDIDDKIINIIKQRKQKDNASYFAFTATPKNITLEKFGVKQADGTFKPFHLYSMKQAIEEGFILDVLRNYTTYKSYYEIQKSIVDNPLFDTKKAQKKLKSFVEKNPQTIATKVDIILDHFISKIVNPKKLKNKAKGMVVTQDIESAIFYYQAIKEKLESLNNPFKVVIAFSGKKEIKGIEYTEDELNGFASKDISEKFDSDEYKLLVVANKFLTGFDQPKLSAMYVDKKLQGVLCVQALSRLNRSAPKLGKKTEDLFVLDFFNNVEDIKESFEPFYTITTLSSATDINVLHDLKSMLDEIGVYEKEEIEEFVTAYFNGVGADKLSSIIDICVDKFNELEEDEKIDFKIKAKQFVKIYSQMASIMPYEMVEWEKLFWFLKFLIPKLIVSQPNEDTLDELLESVDLSSYAIERVKLNEEIILDENESILDPQNPNPRGIHNSEDEKDELDLIIKSFNEKWFAGWSATPEEQKVRFVNIASKIKSHPDFETKILNNPDEHTKNLAYIKIFDEIMRKQRKEELELYRLIAQDSSFKTSFQDTIRRILTI